MIPRLRPPFGLGALARAALHAGPDEEEKFEHEFAARFGFPHALYFAYGRAALHALLSALGWKDQEVLVPAYTCAVVPHAVMLTGNRPRFVDAAVDHFNTPAEQWAERVTPDSAMAVVTPLFGFPVDRAGIEKAVRERSPRSFLLYDMAHGFDVEDREGPQVSRADGALYGLGIGKHISTLYGGMLCLRNAELAASVRAYRDRVRTPAPGTRAFQRTLYGLATWAAFREPVLSLVDVLERRTPLLHAFTEAYYGKDGPSIPADHLERPTSLQAALGRSQLKEYDKLEARRWASAQFYEAALTREGFPLFAHKGSPTFSHMPLPVADRAAVVSAMLDRGIQLGQLIDYACPDLPGYEAHRGTFPAARRFATGIVNLPTWPGISPAQMTRVVAELARLRARAPALFVETLATPARPPLPVLGQPASSTCDAS